MIDSLSEFLKSFDYARMFIQIPLPKPKVESGFKKLKDNFFVDYYKDIIEQPNRHIRFSFRIRNNNSCVFSVKKFEIQSNQFIFTEIV